MQLMVYMVFSLPVSVKISLITGPFPVNHTMSNRETCGSLRFGLSDGFEVFPDAAVFVAHCVFCRADGFSVKTLCVGFKIETAKGHALVASRKKEGETGHGYSCRA